MLGRGRTFRSGDAVMDAKATARTDQRAAENELLLAVAREDVGALRTLYRAFERPLYTLGMRWLRDASMAEELVQEVTLRVWRRAASFDPSRGAASSWIFGVARNTAADLARKRSRAPLPVGDVAAPAEPWDEDSAWIGWQVSVAVRALPPEQQEIVRLAYSEDMTQSEIARRLGLPLGTVKTRLYSALGKLRVALRDQGMLEEPPG